MYIGTKFPYKGYELTDSQYRMLNSEDKKLFTKEPEENDIIDDIVDIGIGMAINSIFSSDGDDSNSTNTNNSSDFDFGGGSSDGGGAEGGW